MSFFISGHKSFLGFFYLHYAYNNAVVHVFMKILKESIHDDPSTPMDSPVYEKNGSPENGVHIISSKWHAFISCCMHVYSLQ